MELDLIFNKIGSKFFVKMNFFYEIQNSKNQSQNQTKGSLKKILKNIKSNYWN